MVSALATLCTKDNYENELTCRSPNNALDSLTGRGGWTGWLREQGERAVIEDVMRHRYGIKRSMGIMRTNSDLF